MKKLTTGLLTFLLILAAGAYGARSGKIHVAEILSLSNDANGCFEDQGSGATVIDLNGALVSGGKCRMDSAQQIAIEGTGNNSGITYALIGIGPDGKDERETLTGANNGTALSVRWYKDLTSITPSGAITGNIEGGPLSTNGAVSAAIVPELVAYLPAYGIVLNQGATMTVTVRHTMDNTPSAQEQTWIDTVGLTSIASTGTDVVTESNIMLPVGGLRIKITSWTSGTVKLTILQARK